MSSSNKAAVVEKVFAVLRKQYDAPGKRETLPVLEELIMAVLADGATTEQADAVFQSLKKNYFDWNEVRVSAVAELQEHLGELPNPEQRAYRLKACLKYIFESTYGFDLEAWQKIPMKEVAAKFENMPHVSDYLVSRVIRDGLGGTAMPLDTAAVRVFTRLGVIDEKHTAEELSASLARRIPRAKSFEFCHVISEFAGDRCTAAEPHCKGCCLLELCPTGERRIAEQEAAAAQRRAKRKAKSKPARARAKAK
jgi:endonuclease-3